MSVSHSNASHQGGFVRGTWHSYGNKKIEGLTSGNLERFPYGADSDFSTAVSVEKSVKTQFSKSYWKWPFLYAFITSVRNTYSLDKFLMFVGLAFPC